MDYTLEKVSRQSRETRGYVSTAVSTRKSRMSGGIDPIKVKSREWAEMSLRKNYTDCGAERRLAEVMANNAHGKIMSPQTPMCHGRPWCFHDTREIHFRASNSIDRKADARDILRPMQPAVTLVSVICHVSAIK